MATSPDDVDRVLRSKLGVKESPPGSNLTEFGGWYGFQGVPWCMIFISWGFWTAFRAHGDRSPLEGCRTAKGAAYCGDVINQARREGRFRPNPKRGYIVVYDWPGNRDRFDHVGFVTWVDPHDGNHLRALEGNTSPDAGGSQSDGGQVVEKDRRNDHGYIHGFYDIPYSAAASKPAASKPAAGIPAWPGRVITLTSPLTRGADVTKVQARLGHRRAKMGEAWIDQLAVDGVWGPATSAALTEYQKRHRLEADGQCGPVTWTNLHTAPAVK